MSIGNSVLFWLQDRVFVLYYISSSHKWGVTKKKLESFWGKNGVVKFSIFSYFSFFCVFKFFINFIFNFNFYFLKLFTSLSSYNNNNNNNPKKISVTLL